MSNTRSDKTADATLRSSVKMASLAPYLETQMILPTEKVISSKNMVEWGTRNMFPDYLLSLYNSAPTLRSIINGNIDYIVGDDVSILPLKEGFADGRMNNEGETIRDQVKAIARDFEIYGGFALQVIRDLMGRVSEVYVLDMRYIRSNKENNVFYYCEDWNKVGGKKETIIYPSFNPNLDWASLTPEERERNASSILYVKNVNTQVYPAPLYLASIKACELERLVDDFHISAISNQFVSSAIVNFNGGIPTDQVKEAIEKDCNEKFSGAPNAGRIMYSWNRNKESATEIVEFKVEDFGQRYQALAEHSRRQIFTAFRAIPLLFGMTSEANTGFSTDEYEQSFKLYNRTQITPIQRTIADAYDKVYGSRGVLTIVPFSLAGNTEDNIN